MVSLGGQPGRRQKLRLLIMGQGGGFSVRGVAGEGGRRMRKGSKGKER